jgi:hypothetical protein
MFTGGDTRLVVFSARTSAYLMYEGEEEALKWGQGESFFSLVGREMPEARAETLANYFEKNLWPVEFETVPGLGVAQVVLSREEEQKVVEESRGGGWNFFDKTYPGSPGIVSFSRVGLNAARTQAFVYVQMRCGSLCGAGSYVLLSKFGGEWGIQNSYGIWDL